MLHGEIEIKNLFNSLKDYPCTVEESVGNNLDNISRIYGRLHIWLFTDDTQSDIKCFSTDVEHNWTDHLTEAGMKMYFKNWTKDIGDNVARIWYIDKYGSYHYNPITDTLDTMTYSDSNIRVKAEEKNLVYNLQHGYVNDYKDCMYTY